MTYCFSPQQVAMGSWRGFQPFAKLKDLEEAAFALGVRMSRNEHGELHLSQGALARELIREYLPDQAKAASTPLPMTLDCQADDVLSEEDKSAYGSIGTIGYLCAVSRPDLCVAHSVLGTRLKEPKRSDMMRAIHCMAYIKGRPDYGVVYSKGGMLQANGEHADLVDLLDVYSDADYANIDSLKRKSRTGIQINLAGAPIEWKGVLQKTTALSTTEAELFALVEALRVGLHTRSLLHEIQRGRIEYWDDELSMKPIKVHVDNKSTIAAAVADETTRSLKHVDVRLWWIRDLIAAGDVVLDYVDSASNHADLYTKSVGPSRLHQLLKEARVQDLHEHMGTADAACSDWGSVEIQSLEQWCYS
eukprot:TRINITY_DN357_c0_g2_i18.p1 TRINITY_DN357_c0_g2~~TRINITY_DN357_c0_g2_i18.p1  ORF type:complete len:361 (-),score=53.18 TRINITY_DN357_c0_g2_i18:451-1533(-)